MVELSASASDEEILAVVRQWASLLAEEDYDAALRLVQSRPHWTPMLLRQVITNYGSIDPRPDGSTWRVTPLESAVGGPAPRHEVDRDDDYIGVWFDLPLNGEWSDLTATFDVERRDDGLVLVLDDVHVM